MDRVCVVDLSAPTYLAPTSRECVASVSVAADSQELNHVAARLDGWQWFGVVAIGGFGVLAALWCFLVAALVWRCRSGRGWSL